MENAEVINARACMIGFVLLIIIESIAGKGLFQMLGLSVGQGLGFEF